MSVFSKVALPVLLAPVILFAPTNINLSEFNLQLCGFTSEGLYYTTYYYFLGFISLVWILWLAVHKNQTLNSKKGRILNALITSGLCAFLLSFYTVGFLANYLVEEGVIQDFGLEQYGLIGMLIFLGVLAYAMVRFQAFHVKIFAAQALVAVLWILIGSLLLVAKSEITRIVVAITEIVAIIFGLILIGSVKKEIKQKEKIEELAGNLSKANSELTVANEKLKALDQQKTEFLSIASHQLRAPLTSIKGYSSMLLEGSFGKLSAKTRGAVDVIFISSQKLVMVIEDFLNITRIELGKIKYEMKDIDFAELVRDGIKELEPMVANHKLDLKVEIEEGKDFKLKADPSKISQVILNLIDNAIKYTPQGWIKVKLAKVKGKNRLSVQDSGIGIDAATMEKLFQKYSRAYNASKTNIRGTGLGLYVAKQMVEAHDGKLWVESDGPGKGSTFFVEL